MAEKKLLGVLIMIYFKGREIERNTGMSVPLDR